MENNNENYPNNIENTRFKPNKSNEKLLKLSTYIYIALSIFCCLARCDFNVFFAYGLLIVLREYYYNDKKFYSKFLFHILIVLCGLDVLWIVIMLVYWNGASSNELWAKVTGLRNFVILMSVLEIGIKVYIELILFNDYKAEFNNNVQNLFNLAYIKEFFSKENNIPGNQTAKTNIEDVPEPIKDNNNDNFNYDFNN
jgi:hypothetical protein